MRVARQSHTENRKGEMNLSDKGGLVMGSELVEEGEEGLVKCADGGVEGGPGSTTEGEAELAAPVLGVRCD